MVIQSKSVSSASELSLNLGCGPDDWGDVRVDVDYKTQTGDKSKLNLRADAHHLPFRDLAFSSIRCWHVQEHVDNPFQVLREILRVGISADVRFPIDEGYKKHMIVHAINFDQTLFLAAYRTMRRRAHLWLIKPESIIAFVRKTAGRSPTITDDGKYVEFPRWMLYGRKTRFFRWLLGAMGQKTFPFRFYYEWVIHW